MRTKSVSDMSCGQMHEFALVLDKAGFNADMIQRVVNSWGNRMAEVFYRAFNDEERVFNLVRIFNLVVPDGYDHATRLASFHREHGNEFHHFNSDITDENFVRATTKLVPGRRFRVKVFQITRRVSSEDCIAFLRSQNAVLTGAQGASLAYELAKDQLPYGKWSISFDEKEVLWKDSHCVSYVHPHSGSFWNFSLGRFGRDWGGGDALLCFCDPE